MALRFWRGSSPTRSAAGFGINGLALDRAFTAERLGFARVQENPLEKYKILARPTFILYKDGEQVGIVDGVSMPTLEKLIGEHMPEGLLEEEEAAADDEAGEED